MHSHGLTGRSGRSIVNSGTTKEEIMEEETTSAQAPADDGGTVFGPVRKREPAGQDPYDPDDCSSVYIARR